MPSIGNLHIYTENPWLVVGTESNVLKSRPAGYVIGFATDTRKFFVFDIYEGWLSPRTAVAKHTILSEEHEDTKIVDPLEEGQLLVVQKDPDDQDKLKWTALPKGTENQVLTSTSTSVEWRDPPFPQHNLLDADAHDDTNTTTVMRGMLITGQDFGGTAKWSGLSLGERGTFLKSDGTDVIWSVIDWSDVTNKPDSFSVTVRQNSGPDIGTRPRLNFIEGSNITMTISDNAVDDEIDITINATGGSSSTHNLLQSDVHTDTNTASVSRGAVIVGQDVYGDILWNALVPTSSNTYLKYTGFETIWDYISWDDIYDKPSEFPVAVYRNYSLIASRPGINLIEGPGINITASDAGSVVDITIESTASTAGQHQLLSTTHDDTNPTTVERGMIITGQDIGGDIKWSGLTIGTSGQVLKSDGTDAVWSSVDWNEITGKPSSFPVTVRKNSGPNIGTRPRLNFIEGSNVTLTINDDNADNEIDITVNAGTPAHNLLQSDVHPDTVTTTVQRGMIIVGQLLPDGSGNIKWVGLEPGLNDQFLRVRRYTSTSAEVVWDYVSWAAIWGKPAAFHVLVKKNSAELPAARAFDLNFIEGRNVSIDVVQFYGPSDDRADITISVNSIDWSEITNRPSSFPIAVRKNSGTNIGTRPRLNFIEGSNITLTVSDDAANNEVAVTIAASSNISAHNLLQSSVHTDTNTASVSRGAVIVGKDFSGTDKWDALVPTTANTFLKYNGVDTVWASVSWNDVSEKPDEFPVSMYRNNVLVGTRPRINFIEGSGISISATDDPADNKIDLTFSSSGHELLSSVHDDTNPTTVTRGMIITGQDIGGFTRWSGLALGTSGQVLKSNGTDAIWDTVDWTEITNKPSSFPITVRKNSGANVGTRPRLNFIEGSNITLTVSDDATNNEVAITIAASGGVSTHNLLQSSVHNDTNTASVSRGAVIVGRNFSGINRWDALAPTTANTFLKYNGVDAVWASVSWGDVSGKPTEFPVSIYRNTGLIGTRPRINFIEGSGISISASDDSTNNRVNLTFAAAGHTLLGSTHSDTNPTTVTRGMIIVGRDIGGGVIRWSGLSLGAASSVLKSNGFDAVWSSLDWSEITGKPSSFPVTVQRNGGIIGNRSTLNFIEGTGVSITASDTGSRIDLTFQAGPHQLLSSSHSDTNPTTVTRGMIITGQNIGGIIKWSGLSIGTSGQVVKSNGTDVVWSNVDWSEVAGKPSQFPVRVQENGITISTRDTLNFRDGSQTNTSVDFTIQDDATFSRTIINAYLVGDIGTPTNADRWKIYGTNRGNPPSKGWYTRPWRHIGTRRDTTDTNEYNPNDVALSAAFNVTATGTPPSSVGQILDAGGTNPIFQCVLDVPGLWIVRLFFQHLGRISTSSAGTGNRMECLLQMMKKEGTTESTVPESPAVIRTNWVQFYSSGSMPTISYGQSTLLLPIRVTYTGTSTDIRGNSVTGTVVFFKVSSNIVGSTTRLLDQYTSSTTLNAYLVNPDS